MVVRSLLILTLTYGLNLMGEGLSPCATGKRCVFGPLPITGSAFFSDAAIEINIVNPSEKKQTINVELAGLDGITFNDNLVSLIELGFVDGYDCDSPAGLIGGILGAYRHCKIKNIFSQMPSQSSLTLPIQVKVRSGRIRSGAMFKIEITEPDGNVMATVLVHKNEVQNWAGLGCSISGCGVGGAVGTVSNTLVYPLNGGKPF